MKKELLIKFAKNLLSALLAVVLPALVIWIAGNGEQVLIAFGVSASVASVLAAFIRTIISAYDLKQAA